MLLFEKLKARLGAEGLFDQARKQELPRLPRIIGVVTSPTGAVIRDILHRLADRFPTHVIVWPVLVQGDGAAQIAAAIRGFGALTPSSGPAPRPGDRRAAAARSRICGRSTRKSWCGRSPTAASRRSARSGTKPTRRWPIMPPTVSTARPPKWRCRCAPNWNCWRRTPDDRRGEPSPGAGEQRLTALPPAAARALAAAPAPRRQRRRKLEPEPASTAGDGCRPAGDARRGAAAIVAGAAGPLQAQLAGPPGGCSRSRPARSCRAAMRWCAIPAGRSSPLPRVRRLPERCGCSLPMARSGKGDSDAAARAPAALRSAAARPSHERAGASCSISGVAPP